MRRRYGFDERKIKKFMREKRGTGVGKDYKPWLTVRDVPSTGRVHRIYSKKVGREHHLMSDNEYYTLLPLIWDDNVLDIREQFPLNRRETIRIAALCGIRHPVDPVSRVNLVMTTDFLVTLSTPTGMKEVAISVKEAQSLLNARTLEKLEIERRYFEFHNIEWRLVTNLQVKNTFTKNLKWIYGFEDDEQEVNFKKYVVAVSEALRYEIKRYPDKPLRLACQEIDAKLGYRTAIALRTVRAMLWKKILRVDLNQKNITKLPLRAFTIERGEK